MRILIVFLIRFLTGASARWTGCAPAVRQRIFFANHTSNLDGPVLWAALPAEVRRLTRPVAARDYWEANAVRRYLSSRVFNAVLIERKHVTADNNPIEALTGALDAGSSLIIFPEGGRSPGADPGAFKSGLYHLGKKRPDVELVPVYIDNMNRILPKGEVLPVPLLSCLRFGAPLRVEPEEGKQAFLDRARNAVVSLRGG